MNKHPEVRMCFLWDSMHTNLTCEKVQPSACRSLLSSRSKETLTPGSITGGLLSQYPLLHNCLRTRVPPFHFQAVLDILQNPRKYGMLE